MMLRIGHAGQLRLGQRGLLPVIRLFNLDFPVQPLQPPQLLFQPVDLPPKTGPGVKLDMGWMSRTHPRTYRTNINAGTKIGVGHYSQTHPHT